MGHAGAIIRGELGLLKAKSKLSERLVLKSLKSQATQPQY